MTIKHGRYIFGEMHVVRKGLWAFFSCCAFRVLIGGADKLQPHEWRRTCTEGPLLGHFLQSSIHCSVRSPERERIVRVSEKLASWRKR